MPKLDIDYVRTQFPAFNDPLSAKWSFFENAGGSYVPSNVIERLKSFYDLYQSSAIRRV
jgi:selenocysteine lyase/cysteine desulfurase